MILQGNFRSLATAFSAFAMAVSSCALLYTDQRLNQSGIGSPLGIGDTVTGTCAIWLQPWLVASAGLGILQAWSLSLGAFLGVGIASGFILGNISALVVRRWPRVFWPAATLFTVLAIASLAYSVRNAGILATRQ